MILRLDNYPKKLLLVSGCLLVTLSSFTQSCALQTASGEPRSTKYLLGAQILLWVKENHSIVLKQRYTLIEYKIPLKWAGRALESVGKFLKHCPKLWPHFLKCPSLSPLPRSLLTFQKPVQKSSSPPYPKQNSSLLCDFIDFLP